MDLWTKKYEIAKKYFKEYGDLLVPDKFHYSGINLGNWIYLQRKKYKENNLSKEKIDLLNQIGMVWNALPDYEKIWNEKYNVALEFKNEFNTLIVPHGFIYKNYGLGKWISYQRQLYKKQKLSPDRIKKLEEIGMVWDASNNNIGTSFPEQAIFYYVRHYFADAINRYRDLGFELDIFIPSINTAIEYDGFLWHKKSDRDLEKNRECAKHGIRLIRIREKGLDKLPSQKGVIVFVVDRGYPNLKEVILRILRYLNVKDEAKIDLTVDKYKITENYISVYNDYWNRMYNLAKEYYEEHHRLVGIKDEFLNRWVSHQRQKYAGHKTPLRSEQIKKLEEIGMKWDVYGDQWEETYKLAKDYYNEHGDLNIGGAYECRGVKLGQWITAQRNLWKSGKLSKKRADKLDAIGMVWDLSLDSWNRFYGAAKSYYDTYGNLKITKDTEYNGVKLGSWINYVRQNKEKQKLTPDRIKQLESIGIVWKVHEDSWSKYYASLLKYYDEHHNILVPFEGKYDGVYLGRWLKRQMGNKDKLTAEQINLLEELGITWKRNPSKWDDMYEIAKQYYEEYGDLMVNTHARYKGKYLGRWINKQRVDYQNMGSEKANANFSLDRIKKLEDIGMVWDVSDYLWNKNYSLLKEYYDKVGDIDIPHSFEYEGTKLGVWLDNQRGSYKGYHGRKKLTGKQIALLNQLGVKW